MAVETIAMALTLTVPFVFAMDWSAIVALCN
jgi:hypothetical protein